MTKTVTKKKIKMKWGAVLILLLTITGIYFAWETLVALPITNIYIKGNSILNDQELIELAGIEDYPSFIKTTSSQMEKGIKKSPYIEKVEVKRKIWGQVVIEITEVKALFINTEGNLVLSNKKEIERNKELVVATLINYTPDTKYDELIKQLSNMKEEIRHKISEIKYDPTMQDKDRFALYMNDGNLVYVTLTKFKKINYYNDIINDVSCQRGIFNLDSGNHFEIKEEIC